MSYEDHADQGYYDDVELAGAALARGSEANWELARLTAKRTRDAGAGHVAQPDKVTMERWCADVERTVPGRKDRFSPATGRIFKKIYMSSLQEPRENLSWTEAYYAATNSSSEDAAARRALSEARNARPEIKARMIQELSADPEVAPEAQRAAFTALASQPSVVEARADMGSPTSRAASELDRKADALREDRRQARVQSDPVQRHLTERLAVLSIEAACNEFRIACRSFAETVTRAMPEAGQPRDDELYWIREALSDARSLLDRVQEYAETGRSDIDAFLADVLGEGERR
jgi:hypothetical protein